MPSVSERIGESEREYRGEENPAQGGTIVLEHEKPQNNIVFLNQDQLEFIQFQHGSAILQASVGTGKTLSLARRAALAVESGIDPNRIQCLTFTNRAAEEMRERIQSECGPAGRYVRASTFHALCAGMLRLEAKHIGLPTDFTILDEDDCKEVLRRIARDSSLSIVGLSIGDLFSDIVRVKSAASEEVLNAALSTERLFERRGDEYQRLASAYQEELTKYHALDFADLVYCTRCMLAGYPDIRERWEQRFSMIQVDEMQDTHLSEYSIIRTLGSQCKNLVLAGDFDQTIYEWRGSTPDRVLDQFALDFPGVRQFAFNVNYRATKVLVEAATNVARSYSNRNLPKSADVAKKGEPITVHFGVDGEAEAKWIAEKIKAVGDRQGTSLGRIAVLTRTNSRGTIISESLIKQSVPHITVEAYEFFRRQEVKDALAYLRFLLNPYDGPSLRRMLLRPSRRIGSATLKRIREGESCGLRLVDFSRTSTLEAGDPFGSLIEARNKGSITVFDTETTGLNHSHDEIIEIAAIRIEQGRQARRFHAYLKNSVSVGESEAVHGFSDEFLQREGGSPEAVLRRFYQFSADSLLVGHNVLFDLRMLNSYSQRLGLEPGSYDFADTLEIARRFVDTDSFTLESLVRLFNIKHAPTHHAMDDVKATCAVLEALLPLVAASAVDRRELINQFRQAFVPLAREVAVLREKVIRLRPADLLHETLERSGLLDYYKNDARRIGNLRELYRLFAERDDSELHPLSALENLLVFASLARNVDRMDPEDKKVKVLTVHQAKGLEFDTVFVAGLADGEFPNFRAAQEGRDAEEMRVFYVAVTRAKEHLYLTGHGRHKGYPRRPSPYFGYIGEQWYEEDSTEVGRDLGYRPAR